MEYYDIKSSKQDNGLWRTPINLTKLDIDKLPSDDTHVKISAVLIAFSEYHDVKFTASFNNKIINIKTDNKFFQYNIEQFELIDNRLFWFTVKEDKIIFKRMQKIKKLQNNVR
jgi:hypothetical protein